MADGAGDCGICLTSPDYWEKQECSAKTGGMLSCGLLFFFLKDGASDWRSSETGLILAKGRQECVCVCGYLKGSGT